MLQQHEVVIPDDLQVVQEVPSAVEFNQDNLELWLQATIARHPYPATPVKNVELPSGARVIVKDESDLSSNRTGTVKDRFAQRVVDRYRTIATMALSHIDSSYVSTMHRMILGGGDPLAVMHPYDMGREAMPHVSVVTSGNEGMALSRLFADLELPAPKLLMDTATPTTTIESFRRERADIYLADLGRKALTRDDILAYTNNPNGIELTSTVNFGEGLDEYFYLVREVAALKPDTVFMPYGSGRLFSNFINLQPHFTDLRQTSVVGVSPNDPNSVADKLTAPFRPFELYTPDYLDTLKKNGYTGNLTSIRMVDDEYIEAAHELLNEQSVQAEPSAAAGLAGLMEIDQTVAQLGRTVVISTGKGILSR